MPGDSEATFRLIPDKGYEVESVVNNGRNVTGDVSAENRYTVIRPTEDMTLTVTFKLVGTDPDPVPESTIETVDRTYVKTNKDKSNFVLVDVRPADYFNGKSFAQGFTGGHIAGAINVPRSEIEGATADELMALGLAKDKTIILYCNMGANSLAAAEALEAKGYKNLKNYVGGMNDWGADPAETVVIAGLELDLAGDDVGTLSVDVPDGTSVAWTVSHNPTASESASTAAVVELSSTTGASVDVVALRPGTAILTATIPDQASAQSTVTVTGTPVPVGGSSGGCDMILAPGALLLLAPLLFLKK